ncbi:hypothetical protein K440DRAFT_642653 [Wilcoxina mikolae CBS 423.85]|nr:hypothetical protein K440DRAFT_642653 [Wilcoxina mikolae CBS 423.85]
MVSWTVVQSLLVFFGPLLYQKSKSFYTSTRTSLPPVPLPRSTTHLLNLLFLTSLLSLLLTTPPFSTENIFTTTSSRLLQTPVDVLFTRLSRLRDLSPDDDVLRSRLASKDARLLYASLGPRPLTECTWCTLEEPHTFLWYAIPRIVFPHLVHLGVLGVATSSLFSRFGGSWRTVATLAGVGLFVVEVWVTMGYGRNAFVRGEKDVVWIYWRVRVFRGIAMAAMDAVLAYVLWLSATRRWSVGWEGHVVEERMEETLRRLERAGMHLRAGGFLKHTVWRDAELRGRAVEWWMREDAAGKELMADEEVQMIRKEKLPARLNLDTLKSDAERKSAEMMEFMTMSVQEGKRG